MAANGKEDKTISRHILFWIPIFVSAVFVFCLWMFIPEPMFPIIGTLLVSYFISPFGKEVLVPTAIIALLTLHGSGQAVQDIALVTYTVVFVDVMCSLFLLWNLDLLKYIPGAGRWVGRIERFGKARMRSRRRHRKIFVALTGYMALPFQGSGGAVCTIIGMVAGMEKKTVWAAVWLGSIAGTLSIGIISFYAGRVLIDLFGSDVWYIIGVLILAGIVLFILARFLWFRRKRARRIESAAKAAGAR